MMPKISVLIPAYNVEKYLKRCLDSVLAQTFTDFEVILVDDGSQDGTAAICDEYALKDSRIKAFHNENQGISTTRNFCLEHASGEYIQFVDSDDWIEPVMLASMYKMSKDHLLDIIECNFLMESLNGAESVSFEHDDKRSYLTDAISGRWAVVWRHMFRKSFLKSFKVLFPRGIDGGEDYFFVVKSMLKSDKIGSCKEYLYHYNFVNTSSFMHKISIKNAMYQYHATNLVISLLQYENLEKKYCESLKFRKYLTKATLLSYSVRNCYRFYPEIDFYAIRQSHVMKLKTLFLLSMILNKLI